MEILERQQVTATFFFMGSRAINHPHIVKDTFQRGLASMLVEYLRDSRRLFLH